MFIQQIFQVFEGWIDYISQSSIYYNCQSAMISIKKFWAQPKIKEYFERNKTKKKFLLNSLGRFQTADFFGPNFQLLGRKIMLYKGYVESIGRKDCDEPSTQTRALRQFAKFDSLWGKNPPKVTFSGDEKDPLVMCRTATPFGLSEEKLKKTHSVSLEMVESHLSHMGMARNFITLSLLRLQSVARSMKVDTTSVTRKVLDRMYDGDDDIFHTKLTFPTAPSFLKIHLGRDETDHKSPPQLLSQLVRTMDLDQQKTWLLQSAKHVNVFKLSDQERAEAEKIKEPEVFQHFLQDKLAELMVEKDEEFPEPPTLSAAKKEILMYESRIQELTREVSHLKSQSNHRHYEKGFLEHEQRVFCKSLHLELSQLFAGAIVGSSGLMRLNQTDSTVNSIIGQGLTMSVAKAGAKIVQGIPIASIVGTLAEPALDSWGQRVRKISLRSVSKKFMMLESRRANSPNTWLGKSPRNWWRKIMT